MKDTSLGTGYYTYTLFSNPKRIIVVNEDYAKKGEEMLRISEGIETLSDLANVTNTNKYFKEGGYLPLVVNRLHLKEGEAGLVKSILKDKIYLTTCINMANEDIKSKKGWEKENVMRHKRFFERIMESL